MDMPKLIPLPIKTTREGVGIFKKYWRWLTSIRQWELAEGWCYALPNGKQIVIPKGFTFDGASVPKALWGILSPTGLLLIQGLVHDFGYRYDYLWEYDVEGNAHKMHEGAGRRHWDALFREVGSAVNNLSLLNIMAWSMLVLFGGIAWKENRRRNAEDLYPPGYVERVVVTPIQLMMQKKRCNSCGAYLFHYTAEVCGQCGRSQRMPENRGWKSAIPKLLSASALSTVAALVSVLLVVATLLINSHLVLSSFDLSISINTEFDSVNDPYKVYVFNRGRKPVRITKLTIMADIPWACTTPTCVNDGRRIRSSLIFREQLRTTTAFKMIAQSGDQIELKTEEPVIAILARIQSNNGIGHVDIRSLRTYLMDSETPYHQCQLEAHVETNRSLLQLLGGDGSHGESCTNTEDKSRAICILEVEDKHCIQLVKQMIEGGQVTS